ncbi:MAG: ChaN family lipoprotein [Hyphomicrobiaceae bacterium]
MRSAEHGDTLAARGTIGCEPSALQSLKARLAATLAEGGIVLLGEVHDNPAHHALQAWLIAGPPGERPERYRPPALVLEHVVADKQPVLDRLAGTDATSRADPPEKRADALLSALDWDHSGWPDRAMFAPVFRAAVASGMPILAGNPARATLRAVAKGDSEALDADARRRLGLDVPLPVHLMDDLLSELEASHCGVMPKAAFTGMAEAQRFRDAFMARALSSAAERHGGAVLLAGNGHVRADRGVPYALRRASPAARITTVMLLEVAEGEETGNAPLAADADGRPLADFVVLTPRTQRPDPCEEMRKRRAR